MKNAILTVFGAAHLAKGYDPTKHRIVVRLDGKVLAQITPSAPGYHDRLDMKLGNQSVGPAFEPDQMRRRIVSVVFGGNESDMARATVERVPRLIA